MANPIRRAEEVRDTYSKAINDADFGYEYPDGNNWKPGSEQHEFVKTELLNRIRMSREHMNPAIQNQWKKIDWCLSAYVPPDKVERKSLASDWRKPVAIVIPATFANLETFQSYAQAAFSKYPIHRFKPGPDAKTAVGGQIYERLLAKQGIWFKELLGLSTMHRDAFTYGIGVGLNTWRRKMGKSYETAQMTAALMEILGESNPGAQLGQSISFPRPDDELLYEGNRLDNIDPYSLILDPSCYINTIQRSEYIGWMRQTNAMELLRRESDPAEKSFNGKYAYLLAQQGQGRSEWWLRDVDDDGRGTHAGGVPDATTNALKDRYRHPLHETTMIVDLIPEEWGVGTGSAPERWMFTLMGDRVITSCSRVDMDHGDFPIVACGPNTTGYDMIPVSHLVTTYGLQKLTDWLIRSRVYNLAKTVNGVTIIDPTKFEMDDVLNPGPGNVWRLKQAAYNQGGIDAFAKQLQVQDVTKGYMQDLSQAMDMMRNGLGTNNSTQGVMSDMPERPTASGIGSMLQASMSRMAYVVRMICLQAVDDLAMQMAYNTRQYMSKEVAISIVGPYEEDLRAEYGLPPGTKGMSVFPGDLMDLSIDLEPHNPVLTGQDDAQGIQQVMQTLMAVPGVAQSLASDTNVVGLFHKWARKMGFDDVYEYSRQGGQATFATMPDEQLQQQVQAGNLVPMSQAPQMPQMAMA